MPTTLEAAYTTITERFIAEWTVATANYDGEGAAAPELRFYGVEKGDIPKGHFARFKMHSVLENQRTFRNGEDQRYVSAGNIFVQVFAPRSRETALQECRYLATAARDIFRGKTFDGGIVFRNVRVEDIDINNERRPLDNFIQKNVVMEYEYDEIG